LFPSGWNGVGRPYIPGVRSWNCTNVEISILPTPSVSVRPGLKTDKVTGSKIMHQNALLQVTWIPI